MQRPGFIKEKKFHMRGGFSYIAAYQERDETYRKPVAPSRIYCWAVGGSSFTCTKAWLIK